MGRRRDQCSGSERWESERVLIEGLQVSSSAFAPLYHLQLCWSG